jgi:CRISPR-associated protein Csb3
MIRVDPHNPGQYLACCGLFELCELLAPGSEAWFAEDGTSFQIRSAARLPAPLELEPAPAEKPSDPGLEPLVLRAGGRRFPLSWWLNETWTDKSGWKTWGGQQRPRTMLAHLLSLLDFSTLPDPLFDFACYTTTRFGVDPRSAWDPLEVGYSPNDEQQPAATYPWVEVLAVIGLEGFRPAMHGRNRFRYTLWLAPLTLPAARVACAAPWQGLPHRSLTFGLSDRGQGYKSFQFAQGADHV